MGELVLRSGRVLSRLPRYIQGAQRAYNTTAAVARGINSTVRRYDQIRTAQRRLFGEGVARRRAANARRQVPTYNANAASSSRGQEDFVTPRRQSSRPPAHNTLNSGNMTPRTPARTRGSAKSVGKRYRTKRGRSSKKTKGRRPAKKRRTGKKQLGSGASLSHLVKMITTPMIIKQTGAFSKNGSLGMRSFYSHCLGSRTDLLRMYDNRPASPFVSPASTTQYGIRESLHVDKNVWNCIIQNRSNWDMKLTVYHCVCRNDMTTVQYNYTTSAATTVFRSDGGTGGVTNVPGGNIGPNQPTLTTDFINIDQAPTFTPYMSTSFCQMFKIVKKENIQLGPNDYVNRTYKLPSRAFSGRYYYQTDGGNLQPPEWIRGWTKFLVFSWVGGPVDTGTLSTSVTTDHTQSKSKPDLYVQYDHHVNYHFSPKSHHLYRIGAGNPNKGNITNADTPIGIQTENNYTTDASLATVAPATATVQVPASAADTTSIVDT